MDEDRACASLPNVPCRMTTPGDSEKEQSDCHTEFSFVGAAMLWSLLANLGQGCSAEIQEKEIGEPPKSS
jgi:hypothetical protein